MRDEKKVRVVEMVLGRLLRVHVRNQNAQACPRILIRTACGGSHHGLCRHTIPDSVRVFFFFFPSLFFPALPLFPSLGAGGARQRSDEKLYDTTSTFATGRFKLRGHPIMQSLRRVTGIS